MEMMAVNENSLGVQCVLQHRKKNTYKLSVIRTVRSLFINLRCGIEFLVLGNKCYSLTACV
jgi:hypothetical protein